MAQRAVAVAQLTVAAAAVRPFYPTHANARRAREEVRINDLNATSWLDACSRPRRPAFKPGELNHFFETLATSSAYRHLKPRVVSRLPWVLQFDNFATPSEAQRVVHGCGSFQQSVTVTPGGLLSTRGRNSSGWACGVGKRRLRSCAQFPAMRDHLLQLGSSLDLDMTRADGINVLQYRERGFYGYHHDYIPKEMSSETDWHQHGPRVLTFMLYLNDVEAGGHTRFIRLGKSLAPRVGRALLWANTVGAAPLVRDGMTVHESKAVRRGIKYVATTWLHAFSPSELPGAASRDGVSSQALADCRARTAASSGGGIFRPSNGRGFTRLPPLESDAVPEPVPPEKPKPARRGQSGGWTRTSSSRRQQQDVAPDPGLCTAVAGPGCEAGVASADGSVCCAGSCAQCGGARCHVQRGGADGCCKASIRRARKCCGSPPCVLCPRCARA